jgi:hypothetical protein
VSKKQPRKLKWTGYKSYVNGFGILEPNKVYDESELPEGLLDNPYLVDTAKEKGDNGKE